MKLTTINFTHTFFVLFGLYIWTLSSTKLYAEPKTCPIEHKDIRAEIETIFKAHPLQHQIFSLQSLRTQRKNLSHALQTYLNHERVLWSFTNASKDIFEISTLGSHPLNQFAKKIQSTYKAQVILELDTYFETGTRSVVIHDYKKKRLQLVLSLNQVLDYNNIQHDPTFQHEKQHLITHSRFFKGAQSLRNISIYNLSDNSDDQRSGYQLYFSVDEFHAYTSEALAVLQKIKKQQQIHSVQKEALENIFFQVSVVHSELQELVNSFINPFSRIETQTFPLHKGLMAFTLVLTSKNNQIHQIVVPFTKNHYQSQTPQDLFRHIKASLYRSQSISQIVKKEVDALKNIKVSEVSLAIKRLKETLEDIDD